MEIIDFNKLWSQSSEDVSKIQDYWDMRAEEFNDDVFTKEGNQRNSTIIDLLISKGMLNEDMEVLDIG
mgnify:FL=1